MERKHQMQVFCIKCIFVWSCLLKEFVLINLDSKNLLLLVTKDESWKYFVRLFRAKSFRNYYFYLKFKL